MIEAPSRQSSPAPAFDSNSLSNGHQTPPTSAKCIQFIGDAVISFDRFGRIHYLNKSSQNLFGLLSDDYLGKPLRQIFPLLSDEQLRGAESTFVKKADDGVIESLRATSISGREIRLSVIAADEVDNRYCQLLLRDESAGNHREEDLLHQCEINQAVLRSVSDGVIITNVRGEVETLNSVARQFLGLSPHAGLGVPVDQLITFIEDKSQECVPSLVEDAIRCGRGIQVEGKMRLPTENSQDTMQDTMQGTMAATVQAAPIRDGRNLICGCVVVIRSLSEASRVSSHLNWQAKHDILTQLPNRHYFEAELSRAASMAKLGEACHGLLYVDLYHFKVVNDICGHDAGDELLRQLATLFGNKMRNQDMLARLGSDEFGLLLRNCTLAGTQRVADNLLREVQVFRFRWNQQQFKIGVSVGALMLDRTIESGAQALSAAHASCCAAKEAGRNRIHIYHNDNAMAQRRVEMQWVVRITEALAENRLVLYRQEIVSIAEPSRLPHFEVLVRLSTNEGKLISPGEFIPAAERYGLMDDVDRWVLKNLLAYMQKRKKAGLPEESYAVNLSGISLGDESFCEFVWSELAQSGVSPKLLHFEITETEAVRNMQRAVEFMSLFAEKGCKFYLDDFGSGLSSFTYLKDFPVHYLKIDGSFVKGMESDPTSFAMVSTINHLAHVMGLKTVAEYVENEALFEQLRKVGVDCVQGYGVALPAEIKIA